MRLTIQIRIQKTNKKRNKQAIPYPANSLIVTKDRDTSVSIMFHVLFEFQALPQQMALAYDYQMHGTLLKLLQPSKFLVEYPELLLRLINS